MNLRLKSDEAQSNNKSIKNVLCTNKFTIEENDHINERSIKYEVSNHIC